MRRAIYVLLVLAAAGVLYFTSRSREADPPKPPAMELVDFVLDSVVIRVPEQDVRVKLADGHAEFESGPVRGTVDVEEVTAHMGTDTFGVIRVNSGGSGTFSYLVLFHRPVPDSLEHRDSVLLGDRVQIVDLRADESGSGVVVTTLGRGEDEPMSAPPTVEATRTFMVKEHRFVR